MNVIFYNLAVKIQLLWQPICLRLEVTDLTHSGLVKPYGGRQPGLCSGASLYA